MYSRLDDILAGFGLALFLSGLYLWLGLSATLMVAGVVLIFIGARLDLTRPAREEVRQ